MTSMGIDPRDEMDLTIAGLEIGLERVEHEVRGSLLVTGEQVDQLIDLIATLSVQLDRQGAALDRALDRIAELEADGAA